MKEQWSISKDKLVNVEDGLISNEETHYIRPTAQTDTCKKLIQSIKFILYLELLLFVGWGCYTIWQTYRVESIELKVTDNIQESESRNLQSQRLHLEESTIAPDEFLTQMENLLQAENTLSKTVDALQKELDEDKINTVSKTMEDPNSRLETARESGIEVKSSPLSETNVPEVILVDLGKDVANDEPKEGSDLSKSEENVLEWTFGLLLFPGAYNIKDRSQIAANDGSEQSKITENLSENENDENIDSAEAERIIQEIAKALRDAKSEEPEENVATPYQRFSSDDSLYKMGVSSLRPLNEMWNPPEEFFDSDSNKDVISDEANVDRTVREDMNGKGLVHVILHNQEPITETQDDFVHENPVGEYGDSRVDESTLLDTTTDEGEEDAISFPNESVKNLEDYFQIDESSWITGDFQRDSRIIDKRSISDARVKKQYSWNNKQVVDNLDEPKEQVIYDRRNIQVL